MSDRHFLSLRPRRRAPRYRLDPEPAPELSLEPRSAVPTVPVENSVVDSAIYRGGHRVASPKTLAEAYRPRPNEPDSMAWIGLYRPTEQQLHAAAEEFGLHELAVEDAIVAHQRPKLERYGDTLFVVLRAARYLDDVEEVEFGELHVFVGPNFVLTVRHSESPDLAARTPPDGGRSGAAARAAPRRCSTPSSTRSSTATPRSWPGCRTTSTRSRSRSSAATPRCRGASTSCPAR